MSIDPVIVVVSRLDVNANRIKPTLTTLQKFLADSQVTRRYKERVDICFHGYDDDPQELFEIQNVRKFVQQLDDAFPYWLYFLTRESTGLQALAFCFLPPFLTEVARRRIWPERLAELLERRWGPALADLAFKAGWTAEEIHAMRASAMHYFLEGPFRVVNIDTP